MCSVGHCPVLCGVAMAFQTDPYITSDKLIYQLVETVACNG